MRLITLILFVTFAASACGNKGPLYMPTEKPPVADDEDQSTPGIKK